MQLDQGACGHEVAGRIQEHGIKWQTTRSQVDQRISSESEPDALAEPTESVSAPQQEQEPEM